MAVVHFEETTGRSEARTLDGEQRYTRTFRVLTDNPLDSDAVVAAFDQTATPFPAGVPGAQFNGNPNRKVPQPGDRYVRLNAGWSVVFTNQHSVCVETRAVQDDPDDPTHWAVTCEYFGVSDPLAQPAEVDWDMTPWQEALVDDVGDPEGDPVVAPKRVENAAGDPFEQGVLADRDRFTLTVVRNVLTWDPKAVAPYQNSINRLTFAPTAGVAGFDPGTLKLKLKASRVRRSNNADFYWRRVAVIEHHPDGWDARVRNAGFNYKDPATGELLPVQLHPDWPGKGGAPSTPRLLKANGDLLLPDDPVPPVLTFIRYRRKDWTSLNLGY